VFRYALEGEMRRWGDGGEDVIFFTVRYSVVKKQKFFPQDRKTAGPQDNKEPYKKLKQIYGL
jgi:hypothetical protein